MTNLYTALPVPVGNGVGAAVDVSTFGAQKTVIVTGTAQCSVNIEFCNDAGQVGWQSMGTIQNSGMLSSQAAVWWMRVRISNYNQNVGGTSSVHVGGTDDGSEFVSLPVPAGNGAGAAVNVSAFLGTLKTVQVGGPFQGTTLVEVSEDGSTEWAQPFSFGAPSATTLVIIARFMRVRRVGVPTINPGLPVVNVGFAFPTVAAGGGGNVPDTRTLTGTAPIEIDGSNAPQDLSADRTISIVPFTTLVAGATTASGAAGNILRGDNTWSTITQLTAALNTFTTLLQGVVPASGAAGNILRGDGSWSTVAQITAALNPFTTVLQGLTPASGAAANFLRGDGTWNTVAQVTAALNQFTTLLQGLVPASGAAANFLRGDATWSTPTQATAALNTFTTVLQGLVPGSGAAANFLRGDGTWSTIAQVTAALNTFTTVLQGLVPASGAAGNVLRGNGTWSTITQLTAALDVFTSVLQGVVPASGGGTSNFLRADGTWAAPTAGAAPAFDTILTPAAITFGAAFDNWNPGALGQNTLIRCTTDGSTRSVRGLVGGVNGITVTLMNVNASSATLEAWQPEDAAATAANRFRTGFNSGGCTYYYDGGLSRWVLITGTP